MTSMRLIVVAMVALSGLAIRGFGSGDPTYRKVSLGQISGVQSNGVYAWLGVPYGKARRWEAPSDPAPWTGTRMLNHPAPPCAQVGNFYGPPPKGQDISHLAEAFWKPQGQEDCLYFNVWCPANNQKSLPVLVFIHGGSNRVGYASDPLYDGTNLAKAGNIVVISTNYRLNWFGWLHHPSLQGSDPNANSGNFALLDLVQALKFIRANVSAFGGDPANVTISGQSAGAVNVNALVVSPLAAGLFKRAISISGVFMVMPVESAEAAANNLIDQLLVKDGGTRTRVSMSNAEIKKYLLSKSTTELINIQIDSKTNNGTGGYATSGPATAIGGTLGLPPSPIGDGVVQPTSSAALPNNYNKVPIIIGTTLEEGKLFATNAHKITDAQRWNMIYKSNVNAPAEKLTDILNTQAANLKGRAVMKGADDQTIAASYNRYALEGKDIDGNIVAPPARFTTTVYHSAVDATVKAFLDRQPNQTWAYSFDWAQQAEPWKTIYGAAHVVDLPFIFNNFSHETIFGSFWTMEARPGRSALSNSIQKAIIAFVKTGDPNDPALGVKWVPATVSGMTIGSKLHFDADANTLKNHVP
jgi:para-nitrobenzyl esterase